ncbi:hypothetical protein C2W64_04268 [Brevibacillus laterosporus]|nr:hypothetical protein [Brevibacillus laterosporus]RAP19154.1 hypothetical protein C2W64_04268 [Brevibacillus laterosporus]
MIKLFNKKPKDKYKRAVAFSLKGLGKQISALENKGFERVGDIQTIVMNGTSSMYEQLMVKKVDK